MRKSIIVTSNDCDCDTVYDFEVTFENKHVIIENCKHTRTQDKTCLEGEE